MKNAIPINDYRLESYAFRLFRGRVFFDVLLLAKSANDQLVFGLCNYVSFKTFRYDSLKRSGMDDAPLAVEEPDIVSNNGIPIPIRRDVGLDCTPAAEVAPEKILGDDMDFVGFFHDRIVDRYLLAGREKSLEFLRLGRGIERR